MKDVDDLELKAEIDQISKKIDAIIERVEQSDPAGKEHPSPEQE
jgi:uncharacterized coiled-coil protein SlyX